VPSEEAEQTQEFTKTEGQEANKPGDQEGRRPINQEIRRAGDKNRMGSPYLLISLSPDLLID
jgi:hypothetical protein